MRSRFEIVVHWKDGRVRPVQPEEDISHIDDDSEYECDDTEYCPTTENIKVKEQFSSSDKSFDIGYAVDIIVRVSREASK